MRPRDKRPNAWQAHQITTAGAQWVKLTKPAVDALVRATALLVHDALESLERRASMLEQMREPGLLCYSTNLLEPSATEPAYCGLPHGHDGPHSFRLSRDDIPW